MDVKPLLASALPLPLLMRVMKDRPWLTRRPSAPISTAFHMLYHSSQDRTWRNTYWMGTPVLKVPLDLWIYQEIMFALKPDLMIETGTYNGGSAFFFASIFDLMGKSRILTIISKTAQSPPAPAYHLSEGILTGARHSGRGTQRHSAPRHRPGNSRRRPHRPLRSR